MKLVERVGRIRDGSAMEPLAIKADSVEEAAAFAAAALIEQPGLSSVAVVVTSVEGWRFVETNEAIGVAMAATPDIAEAPSVRERLALLVPYASGDMASQFKGVAGKLNDAELLLERALPSEFEKALQVIGLDENDTRRLSTLCGRSWSVFRRQHAVNPSIRRPAWLDHPAADALASVCMVGGWSTGQDADTDVVARISGHDYAQLESDLLALERVDDSPLLHIGTVWKAKSALELLAIFGERITPAQLQRYFSELEAVLAAPDPQLQLADEEGYAAAIHGKVRPISGLLLDSLCDTLVKLSVRGADVPALAANDIQGRVDQLVRRLLRGSDRVRWLSLASQLPALAEASPHEFLTAVEVGIAQAGILRLAEVYGDAWTVGSHLSHIGISGDELYRWIVEQAGDLYGGDVGTTLAAAMLCCTSPDQREAALDTILEAAPANGRAPDWLARLLVLCPHDPATWRRAEEIGQVEHYWSNCTSNLWLDDPADMTHALRKLVEHGRPVSALNACHIKFSAYDPELVMAMLEGVLKGHELDHVHLPQSYVFQHAIDFIEESGNIDELRLVQLEFALIKALGFKGEHHARTLYRVMMAQPEVFVELLCLVYKPRNGPPREVDEAQNGAAENAWHILHACRRQPGTGSDGTIDPDQAAKFVDQARRLATAIDRLSVCDITLGEILAHAPDGADGIWPGENTRSLLEGFASEEMLRGFYTGSINKRGTSSRGAYEGGDQERELAEYYRNHALALEATHPQLAATIHDLAKSYDRHGVFEDFDAQLRIEGR